MSYDIVNESLAKEISDKSRQTRSVKDYEDAFITISNSINQACSKGEYSVKVTLNAHDFKVIDVACDEHIKNVLADNGYSCSVKETRNCKGEIVAEYIISWEKTDTEEQLEAEAEKTLQSVRIAVRKWFVNNVRDFDEIERNIYVMGEIHHSYLFKAKYLYKEPISVIPFISPHIIAISIGSNTDNRFFSIDTDSNTTNYLADRNFLEYAKDKKYQKEDIEDIIGYIEKEFHKGEEDKDD